MTPPVLTFNPAPSQPRITLPANACDTHVHIFGPAVQFPFSDARNFTPADAGKEALFALHRQLGIVRCVIVQSMIHGFDNTAVEDAIAAGGGRYLGVALVPHDAPDLELQRLKAAGFRGVRFHFGIHQGQGASVFQVIALTQRLAPMGLHLQIHFDGPAIHELAPLLKQSAVPVVIDHMGRVDASLGDNHADFRALCTLLEDPRFYVKVSGIDRVSKAPPYADGIALARRLVTDFSDRCFWGTDWPHPNHHHVPDDGELVNALAQIAPSPVALEALLVSNPQRFYGFES
jgi:2-pyrone-4,6-dicarboxylate lactonase